MSYRASINSISQQIDEDWIIITNFVFAFHVAKWSSSSIHVQMDSNTKGSYLPQSIGYEFGGEFG
jgi:hypothetical protein